MTFNPGNSSRPPFTMRRYWPYAFDCVNDGIQWEETKSADVAAELRWLADQISPAVVAEEAPRHYPVVHGDSWGNHAFKVYVEQAGTTKINLIKVIRETTHLGLKESKDIADGLAGYGCPDRERASYLVDCWRAVGNGVIAYLDYLD